LEDLHSDDKVILKCVLRCNVRMWSGFAYFRIRTSEACAFMNPEVI
jgi:hypothetical protein